MKRGYQAQTEMNSVWKSLESEVIDDIRNHTAPTTLGNSVDTKQSLKH